MAGIERRLERLEYENRRPTPSDEEERKRHWLAVGRCRRNEDKHPSDWHVWDVIRLLRTQGRLPKTTEELRACLLAWRPPLDESAVERVLAKAIYEQEPGTENMVCPASWRESFVSADELREKYMNVPDETLARWAIEARQHEAEEGESHEVEEKLAREGNAHGITEELMLKAIGPDAEKVGEEECARRLREILADLYHGEKGYRIEQHITRPMNERSNA